MASPLLPHLLAGIALCLLAGATWLFARERAGRLLAAFIAIEGIHVLAHGAGAVSSDPRVAQALLNTLHIPSFFGFMVGVLFVTTITGIHRRFWWQPAGLAALAAWPLFMTVLELIEPSPFWTYSPTGAHVLVGPRAEVASLEGLLFVGFDVYMLGLLVAGLLRQRDRRGVPGLALLVAYFLLREVPILVTYASDPDRWLVLGWLGLEAPSLLGFPWTLVLALLLSLMPLTVAGRARLPEARNALVQAVTLVALLATLSQWAADGSAPATSLRLAFGALLLSYAALRHGLFGVERTAKGWVELPLGAAGFGVLLLLATASFRTGAAATEPYAVPAGLATALVATTLLLAISEAGRAAATGAKAGADASLVGTVLEGRYRLDRLHAASPRAELYEGRDLHTSEPVAVKWALHSRAESSRREAAALQALQHDHIIAVRQVAVWEGRPALVLDWLPGGSLADRLQDGPLAAAQWNRLATELLGGLAAVHRAGLLHGDVKPSNILFDVDGRARLTDFDTAATGAATDPDATLAAAPIVTGTPRYLSPERARGGPPSASADLFAAGATLYEALTGRPPLAPRPNETVTQVLARAAAWGPFQAPVPGDEALVGWFRVALHPDPGRRFQDADAMAAALRACGFSAPPP
ncbi:MAG: serine/threonine-protein kinase [Thermoplasmatota archaeon]